MDDIVAKIAEETTKFGPDDAEVSIFITIANSFLIASGIRLGGHGMNRYIQSRPETSPSSETCSMAPPKEIRSTSFSP